MASCGWVGRTDDSGTERIPDAFETGEADPSPEADESPRDATGFRFVALGDAGTGDADQIRVADRLCRWREKHPFDLVVATGDNIYPEGQPEGFENGFFEPYECLLADGVGFHSSLGNHDIITDDGRPELDEPAFGMPARNHVVRRAGIRFVFANSNAFDMEWLRKATRTTEGDRWTIVVFHHPVYSSGEHGSTPGLAETLVPLFTRRGVDLVLNGHDHLYALSRKIGGVRYVVTGGGGARRYACENPAEIVFCRSRLHFLEVKVTGAEIDVRAVPPFGKPFHRFSTRGL